MALFDDILSGGNWVTGLALGVGAVVILPLAAPILRPLAKAAIKGGILAYQGVAGLIEGIGDLVAEAAAEGGEAPSPAAPDGTAHPTRRVQPRRVEIRTEARARQEKPRSRGDAGVSEADDPGIGGNVDRPIRLNGDRWPAVPRRNAWRLTPSLLVRAASPRA